jgi:hypothetical protein
LKDHEICVVDRYLQKPSIEEIFETSDLVKQQLTGVLIDTGVLLFTGTGLLNLINLLQSTAIKLCTETGLSKSTNTSEISNRFELYSDLIFALKLSTVR